GEKLVKFAGATVDSVFNLINRHQMDVPHTCNGWIQPAHNSSGLRLAEKRVREWRHEGADVSMLTANQITKLIGTQAYVGGWIDTRGGALQPLSYVRELGRIAIEHGASVYSDTPVEEIS